MSLLRLLTAGKSLVGLRDDRSRYVSRGGLPKFGSKKNPFRATTKPDLGRAKESPGPATTTETPALAAVATASEPTNGTANAFAAPLEEPAGHLTPGTAPVGAEVREPATVLGGKGKGARMDLSFDWNKVLFWRRPKPAHQAVPRFSKSMVQGELSLDGVRVVRNDLSDTDLEIVPAKPAPVPQSPAMPVVAPSAKEISPETTWSRVTGRLFGAGKT